MSARTVVATVEAHRQLEGTGFELRRPFPTPRLSLVDPFLLLDEMGPVEVEPGQAKGAPDHPHRGFETVAYLHASLPAGREIHVDVADGETAMVYTFAGAGDGMLRIYHTDGDEMVLTNTGSVPSEHLVLTAERCGSRWLATDRS